VGEDDCSVFDEADADVLSVDGSREELTACSELLEESERNSKEEAGDGDSGEEDNEEDGGPAFAETQVEDLEAGNSASNSGTVCRRPRRSFPVSFLFLLFKAFSLRSTSTFLWTHHTVTARKRVMEL